MNRPYKLRQVMSTALSIFCLLPLAASAQETPIEAKTEIDINDTNKRERLREALSATPPERAAIGANFAQMPEMLETIEKWITHSIYDDPRQLILRDILAAMPPKKAGPLLVQLAKKSVDPELQKHWDRYLRPYPRAYANVLATWLKLSQADPNHVERLLNLLAEFYPEEAIKIWLGLVENNSRQSLAQLAHFAQNYPIAAELIVQQLDEKINHPDENIDDDTSGELASLRLMRALHHLNTPKVQSLSPESKAKLAKTIAAKLKDKRISRRLVALELLADYEIKEFRETLIKQFEKAKNTSEKALALRALVRNDANNQIERLQTSLADNDPTLRLEASAQLAQNPKLVTTKRAQLKLAFEKETWAEIQKNLYTIIINANNDETERRTFQKSVLLNEKIDDETRRIALSELSNDENATLLLDDLKKLIVKKTKLDIIAGTAEDIYKKNPKARPTLQTWLTAQMPLERRLTKTLARFIAAHKGEYHEETHLMAQTICDKADENLGTANVCLHYFKNNQRHDEDQKRIQKLDALVPKFDIGALDDF